MAQISFTGFTELGLSFRELANLPDDVLVDMLLAQAEIVEPAIIRSSRTTGASPHGRLSGFIKRINKIKRSGLPYIDIYPDGIYRTTKNGKKTRAAEVAFIREYGVASRHIPATSFMDRAVNAVADKAVAASLKVYDKYLNSKGL